MHERRLWKDLEDIVSSPNRELVSQMFVRNVMSPLLGSKYVDAGVCCYIFMHRDILTYRCIQPYMHACIHTND